MAYKQPRIVQIEAEGQRIYALDEKGNIYEMHFHKGEAGLVLLNLNDADRHASVGNVRKEIDDKFSKKEKLKND